MYTYNLQIAGESSFFGNVTTKQSSTCAFLPHSKVFSSVEPTLNYKQALKLSQAWCAVVEQI